MQRQIHELRLPMISVEDAAVNETAKAKSAGHLNYRARGLRIKQEFAGIVELDLHENGTALSSCHYGHTSMPESFLSMALSSRSAVDLRPIVESSLCDKAGRRSDCHFHRSAVSFQR
jgi:hypothetical protein